MVSAELHHSGSVFVIRNHHDVVAHNIRLVIAGSGDEDWTPYDSPEFLDHDSIKFKAFASVPPNSRQQIPIEDLLPDFDWAPARIAIKVRWDNPVLPSWLSRSPTIQRFRWKDFKP